MSAAKTHWDIRLLTCLIFIPISWSKIQCWKLINDLLELIGISSCWLFLQFLAMPLIKNGWNGHFSKAKWWMGSQTLVLSASSLGRDWTAVSSSSIYIIELEICCRRTPWLCTPCFAVFFKTNSMSQWSRIVFPMFDGHLGLYRVSPGPVFFGDNPHPDSPTANPPWWVVRRLRHGL